MTSTIDSDRLRRTYALVRDALLAQRTPAGHWVGELSTSALSTATAVMALLQVRRAQCASDPGASEVATGTGSPTGDDRIEPLITGGIQWLLTHQNDDGGWGDIS